MVLVKMLMEIDPLPMRGSLVMAMVMISPSRRDVSPAEQLRRSPRLVPPMFRLVAAEFRPVSLLIIFFQAKRLHIVEDGHRRASRGPTRQGARPVRVGAPPPSWTVSGPPPVFLQLNIFINSKNDFHGVSGLLELCRIGI